MIETVIKDAADHDAVVRENIQLKNELIRYRSVFTSMEGQIHYYETLEDDGSHQQLAASQKMKIMSEQNGRLMELLHKRDTDLAWCKKIIEICMKNRCEITRQSISKFEEKESEEEEGDEEGEVEIIEEVDEETMLNEGNLATDSCNGGEEHVSEKVVESLTNGDDNSRDLMEVNRVDLSSVYDERVDILVGSLEPEVRAFEMAVDTPCESRDGDDEEEKEEENRGNEEEEEKGDGDDKKEGEGEADVDEKENADSSKSIPGADLNALVNQPVEQTTELPDGQELSTDIESEILEESVVSNSEMTGGIECNEEELDRWIHNLEIEIQAGKISLLVMATNNEGIAGIEKVNQDVQEPINGSNDDQSKGSEGPLEDDFSENLESTNACIRKIGAELEDGSQKVPVDLSVNNLETEVRANVNSQIVKAANVDLAVDLDGEVNARDENNERIKELVGEEPIQLGTDANLERGYRDGLDKESLGLLLQMEQMKPKSSHKNSRLRKLKNQKRKRKIHSCKNSKLSCKICRYKRVKVDVENFHDSSSDGQGRQMEEEDTEIMDTEVSGVEAPPNDNKDNNGVGVEGSPPLQEVGMEGGEDRMTENLKTCLLESDEDEVRAGVEAGKMAIEEETVKRAQDEVLSKAAEEEARRTVDEEAVTKQEAAWKSAGEQDREVDEGEVLNNERATLDAQHDVANRTALEAEEDIAAEREIILVKQGDAVSEAVEEEVRVTTERGEENGVIGGENGVGEKDRSERADVSSINEEKQGKTGARFEGDEEEKPEESVGERVEGVTVEVAPSEANGDDIGDLNDAKGENESEEEEEEVAEEEKPEEIRDLNDARGENESEEEEEEVAEEEKTEEIGDLNDARGENESEEEEEEVAEEEKTEESVGESVEGVTVKVAPSEANVGDLNDARGENGSNDDVEDLNDARGQDGSEEEEEEVEEELSEMFVSAKQGVKKLHKGVALGEDDLPRNFLLLLSEKEAFNEDDFVMALNAYTGRL